MMRDGIAPVKAWHLCGDMFITISGQEVELTDGGNVKLHINSLFKSAGKKYKFEMNSPGISFNEDIVKFALDENRTIFITVEKNPTLYMITPKEVIDIVKAHDSIYEKDGLRLYVIPIRALKKTFSGEHEGH